MNEIVDLAAEQQRLNKARHPGQPANGTRISVRESNDYARAINAQNARRTKRAESAVEFIVALVLSVLGAMAWLHWLTPCEAGTLCVASLVPLKRDVWQLPGLRWLRRLYLRRLIVAAEFDEAWHADNARWAPILRDAASVRASELRAELTLIER